MSYLLTFFLGIGALLYVRRLHQKSPLAMLPGPPSKSFIMGNFSEFLSGDAGEVDRQWRSQYGRVVRFKGPFNEDRLFLTDPRAIQHIDQAGYNFAKPPSHLEQVRLLTGKGLLWASVRLAGAL